MNGRKHIVCPAGNPEVLFSTFRDMGREHGLYGRPRDPGRLCKPADNCRISHNLRGMFCSKNLLNRNALSRCFHQIFIENNGCILLPGILVPLHGLLVQRQNKIHLHSAGAGGSFPAPDNREVMPPADEGGVIEIQINPVSPVVEQLGCHCSRTVDTISCFSANQYRDFIHTGTPYVLVLQGGVYRLAYCQI